MLNEKQKLLLEHIKGIKDYWTNVSLKSLDKEADLMWTEHKEEYHLLQSLITDEKQLIAYKKIQDDVISGVLHTFMVMIDSGDSLADNLKLELIDRDTRESLHEKLHCTKN